MNAIHTAVVVGGNRIPFAKAGGRYARDSSQDLLTSALNGLVARFGLAGKRLGEVAGGAVLKHSRDFNLTREAVLGSALDPRTPTCDLQQACATGLETVTYIANKIKLGQISIGIAAGADSTSDAPMSANDDLRRLLLQFASARSLRTKLALLTKLRPRFVTPEGPAIAEPRTGLSMGEHQALTTSHWGISRSEQDEIALRSHLRLAAAWDAGFFDDLVTPYRGLQRDTFLRPDTTKEKLAKLPVVFGDGATATMTAGNSTGLTDGAATVLLANEDTARERMLPMLARVVDTEVAAVDFVHGEEGLLLAPVYAIPRLLDRNRLTLKDFDFYEFHEAFAATVAATCNALADDNFCRTKLGLNKALGTIDLAKLNVHGSSLATGHPFAATGGRIVATAAKLLHERGPGSRALLSVCAAGGQGVTMILEGL